MAFIVAVQIFKMELYFHSHHGTFNLMKKCKGIASIS